MTLQEIQHQIPGANAAELVDLAVEFDRILQTLCEYHEDYQFFRYEYSSDINYLKSVRSAENATDLKWHVDTVIDIGNRLRNEVLINTV